MQRELVTVPKDWSVGNTIDYLRNRAATLPRDFYEIYAVDEDRVPVGAIPLSRLMRNQQDVRIDDIMLTDLRSANVELDQEEVALMFSQYALVSAPVVNGDGQLVGVITADDVVHVIQEEAEEDFLRLGGVQEDDFYEAVLQTTRSRFSWLLVNLMTAIVASLVIGLFDAAIEQVVALAILMPIVASMGGNAGTQTLTVAVRALAMKELTTTNAARIVGKEVIVGGINGILFAGLIGLVTWAWFGDTLIGVVIGAAMIVNLLIAGFAGVAIPIVLQKLKVDPAVGSAVVLTTITDVVGFAGVSWPCRAGAAVTEVPVRAPYGTWPSSISARMIADPTISLSAVMVDDDALYWLEGRPSEGGRVVLVRDRDGDRADITPGPYSVRSRAHEYGGGAATVADGTVYFVNHKDQQNLSTAWGAGPGGSGGRRRRPLCRYGRGCSARRDDLCSRTPRGWRGCECSGAC